MIQSNLHKMLDLSSREVSRICLQLEKDKLIKREHILFNGRWTYILHPIFSIPKITVKQLLKIDVNKNFEDNKIIQIIDSDGLDMYHWHKTTDDLWKKRYMKEEINLLSLLINRLNITDEDNKILIKSYNLFKDLWNKGYAKGRDISVLFVVALYVICRKNFKLITFSDINNVYKISTKSVTKFYRKLITNKIVSVPPKSYTKYLDRILDNLKKEGYFYFETYEETIRDKTISLIERAKENHLTQGKHAPSIIAACIYLACDKKIPQSRIAYAAGVTEVTLRNRYQELGTVL